MGPPIWGLWVPVLQGTFIPSWLLKQLWGFDARGSNAQGSTSSSGQDVALWPRQPRLDSWYGHCCCDSCCGEAGTRRPTHAVLQHARRRRSGARLRRTVSAVCASERKVFQRMAEFSAPAVKPFSKFLRRALLQLPA